VAPIIEKIVEDKLRWFDHVAKTCRIYCSTKSRSNGGKLDQKR